MSGDSILVGAIGDDDAADFAGAAYLFRYNGDAWTQRTKLIPDDAAENDYVGNAVAIAGAQGIVGSAFDDDYGEFSGAAYVFTSGPQDDCNGNWRADSCELADGSAEDLNENGIPDDCENLACPENLDGQDGIGQGDLNQLLNRWGDPACLPGGASAPCPEDLDGLDGVGQGDLNAVLNRWGDPLCE